MNSRACVEPDRIARGRPVGQPKDADDFFGGWQAPDGLEAFNHNLPHHLRSGQGDPGRNRAGKGAEDHSLRCGDALLVGQLSREASHRPAPGKIDDDAFAEIDRWHRLRPSGFLQPCSDRKRRGVPDDEPPSEAGMIGSKSLTTQGGLINPAEARAV